METGGTAMTTCGQEESRASPPPTFHRRKLRGGRTIRKAGDGNGLAARTEEGTGAGSRVGGGAACSPAPIPYQRYRRENAEVCRSKAFLGSLVEARRAPPAAGAPVLGRRQRQKGPKAVQSIAEDVGVEGGQRRSRCGGGAEPHARTEAPIGTYL